MMRASRTLAQHSYRCLNQLQLGRELSAAAAVEMASSYTITDDLAELIDKYTKKKQTCASLDTLVRTGRGELLGKTYEDDVSGLNDHMEEERIKLQVARFIRRDLPIRLAHRIQDLDRVPMMRDMPSVQKVKNVYVESFLDLALQPKIRSLEDEQAFASLLQNLYTKHSNVLMQMAQGAYELREAVKNGEIDGSTCQNGQLLDFENMDDCHKFLDRFYMSRIGIRVLVGQYLALRDNPPPSYVGMICSQTSPYELVDHAARDAAMMCERTFGAAPRVQIQGSLHLTFPYIPTHLHYILLELLKNAMRATMEKHGLKWNRMPPPVKVVIADGAENEDVVIKVSDEGGGICRSQMDKIWSYLYTTADPAIQRNVLADHDHSSCSASPLAGLGYGLPISRSYLRYFGGDLVLMSMEGYGTDAFVYLKRLGTSKEPEV